ncbi:VOC family protein [Leifsonia sp. Leaf264]|uniref:VOC family protein n=1 Tax=Leifsonia sp. Leaf264 TaxID=1736314 RepID=UPI0006FF2FA6|nr:VOC family protein [Leifsonia sp. Leaf264]KQP01721.1 glyoxalase [Leifsonia sp. Leaf264]
MIESTRIFSGFAVPDVPAAKAFYADTLGLGVTEQMGGLVLDLGDDHHIFVYPKPDHVPATYTILNLEVADIDAAVDSLEASGVRLLRYEGFGQDERGIQRPGGKHPGPDIAWFTDPAGNILSVLQPPAE